MAIPSRSLSAFGTLPVTATSQRLMKIDATDATSGFNPASMRRSMPRVGGRQVLLVGEQQRDVDRHAREDRLFDGRQAFWGARDLDEDIVTPRLRVQGLGLGNRRLRIVRQQRRNFQRNPTVDTAGSVMNRPEQVRRLREILQRELEEEFLS